MKLAAVFNIWADCLDLLPYAIENIRPVVDEIIVVYSWKSNRGNVMEYALPKDCTLIQCEPRTGSPHLNELAKRNAGLEAVKQGGFTHFIMMDSDEFYIQSEFQRVRNEIEQFNIAGTVCRTQSYFKNPTLTIGIDRPLAPFIQKVTPSLQYIFNNKYYPFAYDAGGAAQIDCTRRLNIRSGIRMVDIIMHHMSWVRADVSLKMQNSSANFKQHRSDKVYEDLYYAIPGYFCKSYNKTLIECENLFNLPIYD